MAPSYASPMNRHQEYYSEVFHRHGQRLRDLLRQRVSEALASRRRQFVDEVRSIKSAEQPTASETHSTLHERPYLLQSLFENTGVDQIDTETLLRIQDELMKELGHDSLSLSNDSCSPLDADVTCPICSVCELHMSGTVLSCPCGLQIDTQSDSIQLSTVGRCIKGIKSAHAQSGCPKPLRGSVMRQNCIGTGMNDATELVALLCLECDSCSFLEVVV
ncbi:unnamed protein product [Dicrocoelium dendriticum]|nr:unnamed protein product [Dicrocoelium dendriticum]